eukprot:scaffold84894_cov30-Tisochrysis_lutea.AAC.1
MIHACTPPQKDCCVLLRNECAGLHPIRQLPRMCSLFPGSGHAQFLGTNLTFFNECHHVCQHLRCHGQLSHALLVVLHAQDELLLLME